MRARGKSVARVYDGLVPARQGGWTEKQAAERREQGSLSLGARASTLHVAQVDRGFGNDASGSSRALREERRCIRWIRRLLAALEPDVCAGVGKGCPGNGDGR